jgi:Ca-activated chloride channel family protein
MLLLAPATSFAQGVLVPQDRAIRIPGSYKLTDLDVEATLREQVATVQVSQTFQNTGSRTMQVQFVFPIPDGSALDSFTLMVDGKEMPARLLKRDEARRIYEEIVRRQRDPALLEYVGRDCLQTSVFPLPAGAARKVVLRYTELARRDSDLVEFAFPLSTAKHAAGAVERLRVTVRINAAAPLKNIYSPTHEVEIDRPDETTAVVKLKLDHAAAPGDFRLFYQESQQPIGATLLSYRPDESDPGYFLLLASPDIAADGDAALPKTVVFVVDRSGSMSGAKFEQAKGALRFVLNNLKEGDTFNIVAYDSAVETFKPELERYDDATRREALSFVDGLFAGGSTDIDGALGTALAMIGDRQRPSYVLFLTDGLPTAGERREPAIVENARKHNEASARLFAFGVGYDVNARLLDRLVRANHGISEYVAPTEDIEAAVSRFYAKVGSPALTDLKIELAGAAVNRSYPQELPDLFRGGQLVWVGRYREPGETTIRVDGRVGDEPKHFEFPGQLVTKSPDTRYGFVEKLWAVRRVGEIIDELDLKGTNEELIEELVRLSTEHGILTPYTAFLADERTELAAAENLGVTRNELRLLARELSGARGVRQRDFKGRLQQADQAVGLRMGSGGGGGGFAGQGAPSSPRRQLAEKQGVVLFERLDGDVQLAETVRNVGQKTFYRRDGVWIDSTLAEKDEKELAKATVVEQFSDEFFEIVRQQKAEDNQYFTFDEPVTLAVNGKLLRIVPPAK